MRRNSKREKGRERGGKEGEDWKKRNNNQMWYIFLRRNGILYNGENE